MLAGSRIGASWSLTSHHTEGRQCSDCHSSGLETHSEGVYSKDVTAGGCYRRLPRSQDVTQKDNVDEKNRKKDEFRFYIALLYE